MTNLPFYHPSSRGNGFAASFRTSFEGDCIFATLIKQSGWDSENKIGSFKASRDDVNANVTIKLNLLEISAILDCIERGRAFNTFHDSVSPKTIQFVPWFSKTSEEGQKPEQRGFSFSITVGSKEDGSFKNPLYIGFNFAEARLIREFLVNSLNACFDKDRSEQKDYEKNRSQVVENKEVI